MKLKVNVGHVQKIVHIDKRNVSLRHSSVNYRTILPKTSVTSIDDKLCNVGQDDKIDWSYF